ncbi:MAG: hypothetical protein DI537_34080 [Stutzerimonas stutzeri]|nr:MAG: hypothetical protein DI537_34080 [Stutzerimonas stutzeri]
MARNDLIAVEQSQERSDLLKFCAPNAYGLENLRGQAIFCQHYAAFNDPFEFWARLQQGIPSLETERARFVAAINEWGFSEIQLEDALPQSAEYFESLVDAQPDFSSMYDGMRIACFGSEIDNLLMWSHYADGLRGFCIVFDKLAIESVAPDGWIADVAYLSEPPIVDSFIYAIASDQEDFHAMAAQEEQIRRKHLGTRAGGDILSDYEQAADVAIANLRRIWQHAFASKTLQWQYERERRLLLPSRAEGHQPLMLCYPKAAIRQIVVGERMPESYLEQIRVVASGIPIRTARRCADLFQLVIS